MPARAVGRTPIFFGGVDPCFVQMEAKTFCESRSCVCRLFVTFYQLFNTCLLADEGHHCVVLLTLLIKRRTFEAGCTLEKKMCKLKQISLGHFHVAHSSSNLDGCFLAASLNTLAGEGGKGLPMWLLIAFILVRYCEIENEPCLNNLLL